MAGVHFFSFQKIDEEAAEAVVTEAAHHADLGA